MFSHYGQSQICFYMPRSDPGFGAGMTNTSLRNAQTLENAALCAGDKRFETVLTVTALSSDSRTKSE